MSSPRPLLIVSLPGRTVADLARERELARQAGADLAEIRIDRLGEGERERLGALFPTDLPLLATYRSSAEGGEGAADPATRRQVLGELAGRPFRWIDLELERDQPVAPELPPMSKLGRIVSCHPGDGSRGRWGELIRRLDAAEGVGKLVVPATVEEVLSGLLPLMEQLPPAERVVLTTGPSGPLLRALAGRLGFPFVYSSLPERAGRGSVETSQVPVDRLRPFLGSGVPAPWFVLAGRPVAHSRSPSIHSAWMRAEGRAGLYVALEFSDEREFVEALEPLGRLGLRGANVTHPFKRAALEVADEVDPGASRCGAANCLVFEDGTIRAENTDLAAMLRRLTELRADGSWNGKELAVVGTGGAARATVAAAVEAKVPSIVVYGRRPEATSSLTREFGVADGSAAPAQPNSLVVHATDVGRAGADALAVPLGPLLARGAYVLDWVYEPVRPSVADAARAAGARYEDGSRLLVYQAAASYAIWWGAEPSSTLVHDSLEVAQ